MSRLKATTGFVNTEVPATVAGPSIHLGHRSDSVSRPEADEQEARL